MTWTNPHCSIVVIFFESNAWSLKGYTLSIIFPLLSSPAKLMATQYFIAKASVGSVGCRKGRTGRKRNKSSNLHLNVIVVFAVQSSGGEAVLCLLHLYCAN